ncbi:MAG: AAA family ATPase [Pseudonocardiaceae bacterium]
MTALWITRGLPASGKTEWAREQVNNRPPGELLRLNRDDLRRMALPTGYHLPVGAAEGRVTQMQHAALRTLLLAGHDVIVDDTNLNPAHLQELVSIARWASADVEIVEFTHVPVDECVRRDAARPARDHVGEVAIREMHARHLSPPGAPGGGV